MKEDLMAPRIKCLAPDITDKFRKDDVFDVIQDGAAIISQRTGLRIDWIRWEKYPELFRLMEWHEERKPKEMPCYVKVLKDGSFDYLDGDIYDEDVKSVTVHFPSIGKVIKVADGYEWVVLSETVYLISKLNSFIEIHPAIIRPATKSEYDAQSATDERSVATTEPSTTKG